MDRMSPLDAAFLEAEDVEPTASLAIGSLAVFEGPAPRSASSWGSIAGRLPLIPRYRQKVRRSRSTSRRPVWVDDPHFDLALAHPQDRVAGPGGTAEIGGLIGRVMTAPDGPRSPAVGVLVLRGPRRTAAGRCCPSCTTAWSTASPAPTSTAWCWIPRPTPGEPRPPTTGSRRRRRPSCPSRCRGRLDLARPPGRPAVPRPAPAPHRVRLVQASATPRRDCSPGRRRCARSHATSLTGTLDGQPAVRLDRRLARRHPRRAQGLRRHRQRRGTGGGDRGIPAAAARAAGRSPMPHALRSLVPVSTRAPGAESIPDNRVSLMLALPAGRPRRPGRPARRRSASGSALSRPATSRRPVRPSPAGGVSALPAGRRRASGWLRSSRSGRSAP